MYIIGYLTKEWFIVDVLSNWTFNPCVCVSHLEVLPLSVLVLFTVCDNDSWIIWSSGQALVILHQLVGFIDAEQLHAHTCTQARTRARAHTLDQIRKLQKHGQPLPFLWHSNRKRVHSELRRNLSFHLQNFNSASIKKLCDSLDTWDTDQWIIILRDVIGRTDGTFWS